LKWFRQSITSEKGALFSIDLMVAVVIMVSMLLLMLTAVNGEAERINFEREKNSLQRKAISLAELIVKVPFEEGAESGAVIILEGKKRAEQNTVAYSNLVRIDFAGMNLGKSFVKEAYLKRADGKKEIIFLQERESKNCFAMERFVIEKNIFEQKAVFGVVVCDE
jgi:hypothetical protein